MKIGDRVRLREDAKYREGTSHGAINPPGGTIGEIIAATENDSRFDWRVKWEGDYFSNAYPESDLELEPEVELRWLVRKRWQWVSNNPYGQIPGPAPTRMLCSDPPVLQYYKDGVWKDIPIVREDESS